jgi:hypothetical protein
LVHISDGDDAALSFAEGRLICLLSLDCGLRRE